MGIWRAFRQLCAAPTVGHRPAAGAGLGSTIVVGEDRFARSSSRLALPIASVPSWPCDGRPWSPGDVGCATVVR